MTDISLSSYPESSVQSASADSPFATSLGWWIQALLAATSRLQPACCGLEPFAGKGKSIPRFLILHVADHPLTTSQSQRLAAALREAEVPAKAYTATGTNHSKINSELGLPDDETINEVFEFLGRAVNSTAD